MLMATPQALAVPAFVRARGGVRVAIGAAPRGSVPLSVAESGGYRVRFVRGGVCEGVLVNTAGGLAGGDRMAIDITVGCGAEAVLTTQSAEKVYRSDGPDAEIAVTITAQANARVAWLPQELILFDGARLGRRVDVALAAGACVTLAEATVFGRLAMGEVLRTGAFRDRWRIRRDGRLVFAEDLRLDGAIDGLLARPAVANGGRAVATILHVGPDAEGRLEEARAALAGAVSEHGVTAVDRMLVARFIAADPQRLRADLARFLERFRGRPLPRSWQT
jgi:urease accessory protein